MRSRKALALVSVAVLTACTSQSQQARPAEPTRGPAPSVVTPLIAEAVAAPVAVPATDGKTHLAYELRLTNVMSHDVTLTSVTVTDRDIVLLNLAGDRLTPWTRVLGTPTPARKIGAAQTAIVWLDVALENGVQVPTTLTHAVALSNSQPQPPLFPAAQTIDVAPVDVQKRQPVAISPPLKGPNWVDGDGCCDTSAHRTALNPINGSLWGAERFAIDYVQLRPDGRLVNGPAATPESYAYFGADIHAVSDGPVVSVREGLPEQPPGRNPTGLPLDQYAGNHVVQDLGDGNYALYAHIKTGTVKVQPGDQLTSGQVLGNVGNTGNTTAPHLHFHVMSTPDPLRSDGLPFVFDAFRLDSRIANADGLDTIFDGSPAPMQPGLEPRDESGVMPLELDVMTYGDR
ncbi:M23 family metallopeptidase [Mycobacterium deserti]|uniref:M23 family metallopeptidase n=1 Tax=Mycobacterium deserti TaxID=2978347 RepID=A0ABT2MCQ5_9MYCO|nr:M23 family metallopeptidase [Mycobacterium deserti]MCT7658905.1 M23 family metallopeptidase [Mycobacterium deserti]